VEKELGHCPLAFNKPQFTLAPDRAGARYYANVDNRMEVLAGGEQYRVAVAVPTGLFTILRGVFNVPLTEDVHLAIDEVGERFVFSIMYGDELRDLWDYSPLSLPTWILGKSYRV